MNRKEFLRQLEQLLGDIPENERREAMEYYQNYFEDAGPENEAKIIEELGSPEKVATSIKKDLFGENYGAYAYIKQTKQKEAEQKKRQNNEKIQRNILIAVVIVLTFPLWIGLVAGAFGILAGAVACVFAIAVAVIVCVLAFLIAGFALTGIGIVKIFTGFPAVGLVVISIGMLMLAFSILGLIVMVWVIGMFVPWAVRGIVSLCKKPFQKRGAVI